MCHLDCVPVFLGGHYPEQNRVRGLWVGCTAVLLYCCTEIPVRCRQIQYVLHLSTPHLRTWYGFFFSLCPKSSLTEDGRGPLAPARPEPLYIETSVGEGQSLSARTLPTTQYRTGPLDTKHLFRLQPQHLICLSKPVMFLIACISLKIGPENQSRVFPSCFLFVQQNSYFRHTSKYKIFDARGVDVQGHGR